MFRRSVILWFATAAALYAETGYDAWLRYAPVPDLAVPAVVTTLDESAVAVSAQAELTRGLRGMTGKTLRAERGMPSENAIVLAILRQAPAAWHLEASLPAEGFHLKSVEAGSLHFTVVAAPDPRGLLYGAFALLRHAALRGSLVNLDEHESPSAPVRWVNQWDNLDGSIERGYGGRSIFWDNLQARADLARVADYGRLLASIGIQACAITSVNANPRALTPDFLPNIVRVADALRPWGVRVALGIDFGSPKSIGGLSTFDPLDPQVAAWWKSKVDEIYRAVPDFAGFVLKADSEGRVGPSTYGRSHADAANVVARALEPHSGLLFYRGFVYDHHMDWNNPKNDRARAAYDNFRPLDGKFDANVIIQVKNGPIDFQVREPASPLFGALEHTSEAIELQITQEYFGQSKHTVFLAPMWKDVLDFDMHVKPGAATPVHSLLRGYVGVANVGLDADWTGNQLSQANLFAFGRLAWNPNLSSRQIADECTRLTFGTAPHVAETIDAIQLDSWRTYENYTGPLGLQTLTDITGNHYGVNIEASERNGWGQWHRADAAGVGMDRTVATGTGYIGQYQPAIARIWESVETCPDDLLLFLHHVPYTHKLHDGKTVIQYIYDSHYEGAAAVEGYVKQWKSLRGQIDDQRYAQVLAQLEYQAGQAVVWRDAVTNYFARLSKIPDARGRVGNYPDRLEAEAMTLQGFAARDIVPMEDASGGKAVACPIGTAVCTAAARFGGQPGWYMLRVEYFDQANGAARYRVWVNQQLVDEWSATLRLPTIKLDSTSSTRRTVPGIALRPGDEIRIEGTSNGGELAALDYIEIIPALDISGK